MSNSVKGKTRLSPMARASLVVGLKFTAIFGGLLVIGPLFDHNGYTEPWWFYVVGVLALFVLATLAVYFSYKSGRWRLGR